MDRWKVYKKCDDYRCVAPKSVLDLIEIKSIAENGIFEIGKGGVFTKCYTFSDINYEKASEREQVTILEDWCRWLNSNSAPFKITFFNKNKNIQSLRNEVMNQHTYDGYDDIRDMFNEDIEERILNSRAGIENKLYLTIRYELSDNYDNANMWFETIEADMENQFANIGSFLRPLDANERLQVLHDFYRLGNEEYFNFDFRNAVENCFDFKCAIANSYMDFSNPKYFSSDTVFGSVLHLKQWPEKLSDRFLTHLANLNIKMMCSTDIVPLSDKDTDDEFNSIYMDVDKKIRAQTQKRVRNKDFNSEISLNVQMDKTDINGMIISKKKDGQHFFYTMLNIVVLGETLEELEKNVELVMQTAKGDGAILDYNYFRQREALNTVLPIGIRQVNNGRVVWTKGVAALFPFNTQDLYMPGGNCYGNNSVSKNLCIGSRKKLPINPHGFVFGETGSGKTTACSLEIMQNFIKYPYDDIIIIDPKNDYIDVANILNGIYIDISATSQSRFNPLSFYYTGVERNLADEKAQLVLAICETCKREPLTAKERSIVNRALKLTYEQGFALNQMVTLTDLWMTFDCMAEPEAYDLKLYLELFVTGSLNIFAENDNYNINNRLTVFGLKNMGAELRDLSMLVMLECIKERVMYNYSIGKATWIYIDEFHETLKTDYGQSYFKSMWMLFRSLGGIITAMTQNVSDILLSDNTRAMVDNSEFVLILKQKVGAKDALMNTLGLSTELVRSLTSEALPGKGLMMFGSLTIPIDMRLKKHTKLYDLFDKNFHSEKETEEEEPVREKLELTSENAAYYQELAQSIAQNGDG